MELPLDLARTFDAVLTAGSLEAAARDLHLTPSAVSQRLRALETRVGRVLLVRSRPVRATEAGLVIARLARQLLTLEQDALAELGLAEDRTVTVPLAVNADSLSTWFLPALAPLAPLGIAFDLYRDDQDLTAGLLEAGTVTAAVTSQDRPVAGCTVRPLGAMRYLPAAAPRFVDRWFSGAADAAAFATAPVVDFDRHDTLQTRYLVAAGADPDAPPRHRVPASSDFTTAVRLGFGWGLVPELQAEHLLATGDLVPLRGRPVEVSLYWQRWNLASAVLEAIEEAVVAAARAALHPAASR